ncbi:calmodulin-like protein 30 [Rhodamnia argentea]|uniref:Calmodulin-like protein 30 n=1 Tax=Rhodamnia argentea TaxID=178133 RepID=A0A8B8PVL9_9MYRT|nr:calmodulin-like protein 30 [Rhodamnia argentea]
MSRFGLNLQYSLSRKTSLKLGKRSLSKETSLRPAAPPKIYRPNTEEMRQVFDKFDANRDGKISKEEYKSAMGVLGQGISDHEANEAFRVMDANKDGFVDFREFLEVHGSGGGIKSCDIEGAFRAYDLDGDGRISAKELWEVMRSLGEKCSLEACKRMVRAVDADGDGCVNMDEFMNMMTRTMKPC